MKCKPSYLIRSAVAAFLSIAASSAPLFLAAASGCVFSGDDYGSAASQHVSVARGELLHVVGRGETLSKIGRLYGVSVTAIARRNNLSRSTLEVGDLLAIPAADGLRTPSGQGEPVAAREVARPFVPGHDTIGAAFAWPVKGRVIRHYGVATKVGRARGIDVAASNGARVSAAKSGRVRYVSGVFPGMGNVIILDHGRGEWSLYGHLASITVAPGETVSRGQPIGTVGHTGRAASDRLHFRVYRHGKPVDPEPLLR